MAFMAAISSVTLYQTVNECRCAIHAVTYSKRSIWSLAWCSKWVDVVTTHNIVMDGVLMRTYKSVTCQQSSVALCLLHQNSHRTQREENIITATGKRISSAVNLVMEHKLRKLLSLFPNKIICWLFKPALTVSHYRRLRGLNSSLFLVSSIRIMKKWTWFFIKVCDCLPIDVT